MKFKKDNHASLYYNKHGRVLKTLPSTCILNYSKVVDWSHLNPRGARLKSLVFYVTPLNPQAFFKLHS